MFFTEKNCLKIIFVLLVLNVKKLVGDSLPPVLRSSPKNVIKVAQIESVSDLIKYYGYPAKAYDVQTEDGYILSLQRMPNPRGHPILVVHGVQATAMTWLFKGPRKDLPFLLYDQGYDVWLANVRGSKYSRRHITLNADVDAKFWNHSLHEMGYYDLPAMIDFILKESGQSKISFVGHSQACGAFFVMTSLKPKYNEKITIMHGLAPGVYLSHGRSPIFKFADFGVKFLQYPFWQELDVPGLGIPDICLKSKFHMQQCVRIIEGAIGENYDNLNMTLVPIILYKLFNTGSVRSIIHYYQIHKTGRFAPFDDGFWLGNSSSPAPYPLSKVSAPIALYYGRNDLLIDVADVEMLKKQLPNLVEDYLVPAKLWNHLDNTIGSTAHSVVYEHLIEVQKRYDKGR